MKSTIIFTTIFINIDMFNAYDILTIIYSGKLRKTVKSTRDKIINSLLEHPNSTVNDLSEAVNINGISVRHHLTHLIAEDLVCTEEVRHGVGRPRLVYRLTEAGMEQFPSKYLRLIKVLIKQIKESYSENELNELIKNAALIVSQEYQESMTNLPVKKRLDLIKKVLSKEGFLIEWEEKDKAHFIYSYNCPYYHIAIEHPEICMFDKTIISTLIEEHLEQQESIINGHKHCKYVIKNN